MTNYEAVTTENLNAVMEFGHVIRVTEEGTVSESGESFYGELAMIETEEGHWEECFHLEDGWQLLTGFTGQYGYSGPVMHVSEYIGGGLARHILETPGHYVAVTVESEGLHRWETDADGVKWCGGCGQFADDGNTDKDATCPGATPAGWAVAFKPLEAAL